MLTKASLPSASNIPSGRNECNENQALASLVDDGKLIGPQSSYDLEGGNLSQILSIATPLPPPSTTSPSEKRVGPQGSHGLERGDPSQNYSATSLSQSNNTTKNTSLEYPSDTFTSLESTLSPDKMKSRLFPPLNLCSPQKEVDNFSKGYHHPDYNPPPTNQKRNKA